MTENVIAEVRWVITPTDVVPVGRKAERLVKEELSLPLSVCGLALRVIER